MFKILFLVTVVGYNIYFCYVSINEDNNGNKFKSIISERVRGFVEFGVFSVVFFTFIYLGRKHHKDQYNEHKVGLMIYYTLMLLLTVIYVISYVVLV